MLQKRSMILTVVNEHYGCFSYLETVRRSWFGILWKTKTWSTKTRLIILVTIKWRFPCHRLSLNSHLLLTNRFLPPQLIIHRFKIRIFFSIPVELLSFWYHGISQSILCRHAIQSSVYVLASFNIEQLSQLSFMFSLLNSSTYAIALFNTLGTIRFSQKIFARHSFSWTVHFKWTHALFIWFRRIIITQATYGFYSFEKVFYDFYSLVRQSRSWNLFWDNNQRVIQSVNCLITSSKKRKDLRTILADNALHAMQGNSTTVKRKE